MAGMDRKTGKRITGRARLAQRIADVLTTPLGSCVMRRDYGSRLLQLIDMPATPATAALLYAATAEAIMRWIADVVVTRVQLVRGARNGAFVLRLEGAERGPAGATSPLSLAIPLALRAGVLTPA